MDPEGILKAWTTKVRISRAKAKAMMIASAYSRNVDFFLISGFFSFHPPLDYSKQIFTAESAERAEKNSISKRQKSIMLEKRNDFYFFDFVIVNSFLCGLCGLCALRGEKNSSIA